MTGAGVGNAASLASGCENKFIDARQGRQQLRQIRGQGNRAARFHLVGNGQLAPLKIHVRPRQGGQFLTAGTCQQQAAQIGACRAVAQLLHTLPPAGHLGRFQDIGAACVAWQAFHDGGGLASVPVNQLAIFSTGSAPAQETPKHHQGAGGLVRTGHGFAV